MLIFVGASMPRSANRVGSAVRRSGLTKLIRCSKFVTPWTVLVEGWESLVVVICRRGTSDLSGSVMGSIFPPPLARTGLE